MEAVVSCQVYNQLMTEYQELQTAYHNLEAKCEEYSLKIDQSGQNKCERCDLTHEDMHHEIDKLKIKNAELAEKVAAHETTINKQQVTINRQQVTINKLERRLDDRDDKDHFKKLLIAIQDINRLKRLETKLNSKDAVTLARTSRVGECHYIEDGFSDGIRDDCIAILLDKLKNMSHGVRKMFDVRYPNIVDAVVREIISSGVKNSGANDFFISVWWD